MIDFSLSDKLKNMYQNNLPYPYIIIDNFLPDFLLDSVLNELKEHDEWYHTQEEWVQNYEVNKFFYPNHDTNMDDLSKKIPITKFVFKFLNSPEMIKFLENLTGFTGISIDPIL